MTTDMTKEEVIDLLDNLIGMIEDNQHSDYDTALKMAIKALKQEPKQMDATKWIKIVGFALLTFVIWAIIYVCMRGGSRWMQ